MKIHSDEKIKLCLAVRFIAHNFDSNIQSNATLSEIQKIRQNFETMSSLVNIRYKINTKDKFYEAERKIIDEISPTIQNIDRDFFEIIVNSKFKEDFKKLSDYIILDSAAGLGIEAQSAIELADVDKVEELDAQIEAKKNDLVAPKMNTGKSDAGATENPVYDEWIQDNQWYLDDNEMAQFADSVAQNYVGAPLPRIYALVRQKVQEVFPEKFASTKTATTTTEVKKPIGPVSPVDKGSNNKGASTSFSKADLTPDQVSIMNQFVSGGIMSEEQYIKDIASMQEQ